MNTQAGLTDSLTDRVDFDLQRPGPALLEKKGAEDQLLGVFSLIRATAARCPLAPLGKTLAGCLPFVVFIESPQASY